MSSRRVLGIGWDVGGWMGQRREARHAVALVEWLEGGGLAWRGAPGVFETPREGAEPLRPQDLVRFALGDAGAKKVLDGYDRVVVAMNAPLGFPEQFTDLLCGGKGLKYSPAREIENPLAYRATERYVYQRFDVKPLSASFNTLGNNATVAISHARRWRRKQDFSLHPFDGSGPQARIVIEVLPALVRSRGGLARSPRFAERFRTLLPVEGSEEREKPEVFEASACAVLAALYGVQQLPGLETGLPRLEGPMEPLVRSARIEGWIYHIAREWLDEIPGESSAPIGG